MAALAAFEPSGVITLTTDFGLADPFVGIMKGRILSRFPAARIVDLTHEVPAHRPRVAGFWLSRCFEYFPSGTVHVAVVDPGVGTDRGIVCMAVRGHLLLAPDNGLLSLCHAHHPRAEVVQLAAPRLAELGIHYVSSTFHGRDIFAPVAAELAAGRCPPEALGPQLQSWVSAASSPAASASASAPADGELDTRPGAVIGSVVTVDHFGNLITDIDAVRLDRIEDPRVHIAGKTMRLLRTYADARPGELLALINSFDVLEIAQAEGNAAAALGVGRDARVTVEEIAEHLLGGANPL